MFVPDYCLVKNTTIVNGVYMSYQSVFAPDIFKGKVIVVTGGGSGIGRCTAHELAYLGATVVIIGRTLEKIRTTAKEIVADGGKADFLVLDIRIEDNVKFTISEVLERHGRIDALVNNAGGQFPSPIEKISKNGFQKVIENNLVGGFLMAKEVYSTSMKKNGGAIVNMTADCANGFPLMSHTGAARAGMENFTKTAAWEWGRYGVRVNAVAPGIVASSGLQSYDDATKARLNAVRDFIPVRRLATEAEISAGIIFLLCPASAYINGETLRIDGGGQFGSSHLYMELPRSEGQSVESFDGFHRSVLSDLFKE